jgi:hypothetical protein
MISSRGHPRKLASEESNTQLGEEWYTGPANSNGAMIREDFPSPSSRKYFTQSVGECLKALSSSPTHLLSTE